jgi:hypothetical protein
MITRVFSARVFTVSFGVAYSIAVYGNYPLFRYYPLTSRISFQDLTDPALGPSMSWFGWIATALIAAVLAAASVPKRIGDRIPAAVLWIATALMLAAAWYCEREWFLG